MLQKLMAACGARREKFFEQMPDNSAAILCAAPEVLRMEDSHYPYRQDNDFFYLTGFSEPEAFAVLTKKDAVCEFFLFCRPNDPIQAAWVGDYVGLEDAVAVYGADGSFDQACFFEKLPELCADDMTIYLLHDRMLDFECGHVPNDHEVKQAHIQVMANLEWTLSPEEIEEEIEKEEREEATYNEHLAQTLLVESKKPGGVCFLFPDFFQKLKLKGVDVDNHY